MLVLYAAVAAIITSTTIVGSIALGDLLVIVSNKTITTMKVLLQH